MVYSYKAVKDIFDVEEYVASWVGYEAMRLRFHLRPVSAGLLKDKRRSQICIDGRCVLCNRGEVEVVEHFILLLIIIFAWGEPWE